MFSNLENKRTFLGGHTMNRSNALLAALVLTTLLLLGCSGSGGPTVPNADLSSATGNNNSVNYASPSLMGYYDVYIDPEAETVEVVPNRNTEFILNVVKFLNNNPLGVTVGNITLENLTTSFNIGLDFTIKHPAPISPDLDVFDMRGAVIFDGSGTLGYNTDLTYPMHAVDQVMLNADGYTRWFNKSEFLLAGFGGYTTGAIALDFKNCEGTFNGYKYFADGLGVSDNAYDWLKVNSSGSGRYTAGAMLSRHMEFNFPFPDPGIKFGYSIFAVWEDVGVVANTPEGVAFNVDVTDDLYYTGTVGGGNLILDIGIFGWVQNPSSIFVESTVLDSPYELSPAEMTPVDSGTNWAVYHVAIPSDSVTSNDGQEFWVIAEYAGYNYISPFGIPNNAGTDTLAAGFRQDILIGSSPYNQPPLISSGVNGADEVNVDSVEDYAVVASDQEMDALTYSWTVKEVGNPTILYSGPGNGAGKFTINFDTNLSAQVGDQFEIDCQVSDPTHDVDAATLVVDVVESPNLPPIIYGGVFGELTAGQTSVLDYSVSASDPDADTLTYSWSVTNVATHVEVFSGPGDGAGVLTIDWDTDIGAIIGEEYGIDCSVSDGINPEAFAETLLVTITNQPPALISGVSGENKANPTDIKTYTVVVVDPEGDPITYDWEVKNIINLITVFDGPGDGAGSFEVDWANDVGASSGENYLISCIYSDPTHPDLYADALIVIIL